MPESTYGDDPPETDNPDLNEYLRELHETVYTNGLNKAVDPSDSTATTVSALKDDYNTLLANLRTAGII
jgi:hypothetical protein